MFKKVLIANRGEIACRVAATCRRLGIATVAVYSDADAHSKHVAACDEAIHIGPSPAAQSYLLGERILEAARVTGAEAIHPGYGFLSENASFARACTDSGIAFIGPPESAIAAMGSKAAAKAMMGTAGVPLVPGFHGDDQDPERLRREADAIGYPVLLKASAGGGGKGMRVVERSEDFAAALVSCQREARASFGDDRVLIEKYLQRPRHVEIQVFADTQGDAVYLFERDCSVQRRHQKVLEEAPAPGLPDATRRAMGEAAVAAARVVGYVGAGTVEFIMTDDAFYFMEMNTRLQVEHPVTEMITGLDLVEWQLRVAFGMPLPLRQEALRVNGHAIEARIYAENPARGFLPSTGTLVHLRTPRAIEFALGPAAASDKGDAHTSIESTVRIDSGVRQGDEISAYYDPMIAKLIVHASDRDAALRAMQAALREYEVLGLSTNLTFLRRLVSSAPFSTAELDTGLIERHHAALFPPCQTPPPLAIATAVGAILARQSSATHRTSHTGVQSPWTGLGAWTLNGAYRQPLSFSVLPEGDETPEQLTVTYVKDAGSQALEFEGKASPFEWHQTADADYPLVQCGGRQARVRAVMRDDIVHVTLGDDTWRFEWRDPLAHGSATEHGDGRLTAPMPGKVVAIHVSPGDTVEKGHPLLVIEAMKMEHTIVAPTAGVVDAVLFGVGDQVTDGAQLLHLTAESAG